MLDSGTKLPENRIHLFDPVGLINDSYGGYRSSSYAVRTRRPTKSYDSFTPTETDTSGGVRSYQSFTEASTTTGPLRSDDNLTDSNNGGLRSYDHSSKDTNGGGGGGGELRFGVDLKLEDESDVSTPRLWKTTPPINPVHPTSPKAGGAPLHPTSPKSVSVTSSPLHPTSPKAGSSPLHPTSPKSVSVTSSPLHPTSPNKSVGSPVNPTHHQSYQTMSPSSRTQVIAKGRRELMEMVRDLPESFYELSLKDIVEQKPVVIEKQKEIDLPEEQKPVKETAQEKAGKNQQKKKSSKKVKKSESKKKMVRSKSVDSGGFLLRTSVFPNFLGAKKRKKSLSAASSFKVAPMQKPKPAPTRSMKGTEKDWWKRKSCISSESEESNGLSSNSASSSSSSSSRSNSSNGRRSNKFLRSFCFFNGRRIRGKT